MSPVQSSSNPTLRLPDGEAIHCGPENILLRHIVEQMYGDFDQSRTDLSTWMPLVLYGDSLCGKSVVAHGLANAVRLQVPREKTIVLTAADLVRALGRTVVADEMDRLSRQLRSAKLLVVDDVQLLAGKSAADIWLTEMLDYRIRHGRPTIMTCNRNPARVDVSDRLRSRMSGGLTVSISLPYAATRKEVILRSAQAFDLSLVDETVDQLVELTNGKPVSGIQSVVASVATHDQDMDAVESEVDLDALVSNLVRSTARRFGIRVADMKGTSRRKNTVLARAIAMFLLREITPLSLAEVGKVFGNRDHSTVRHACEKIRCLAPVDAAVGEALSSICRSLDVRLPKSWFDMLDDQCA